ncbi:MAG: hypothetical protein AB8G22_29575 [Saprospiraceae bacterium]
MKLKLFLLFHFFFCGSLFAQFRLSGVVLSADKSPLEYALVSVVSVMDSTNLITATTDKKDYFQKNHTTSDYDWLIQI